MAVKSTDPRGYAKVKIAARYAGVSERTLREWLKDGLRHIRLKSGTILVQYSAIDEYLSSFEVSEQKLKALIDNILGDLVT